MLPGAQIEPSLGDGHDDLMMHEEHFQVGVAVVLAGIVVLVVFAEGGEILQPLVDVINESALVVVT